MLGDGLGGPFRDGFRRNSTLREVGIGLLTLSITNAILVNFVK